MNEFKENILAEKELRGAEFIVYFSYLSDYIKVFTTNQKETIDIVNTIYDSVEINIVCENILKVRV